MKKRNRIKLPKECPMCGLKIKLIRQRPPKYGALTYVIIITSTIIAVIVYVYSISTDFVKGHASARFVAYLINLILICSIAVALNLPRIRIIKCARCGWEEKYKLGMWRSRKTTEI